MQFRKILPAFLCASLLIFQISIPWTVRHFVTMDGPSHLYTAVVASNLVRHSQSIYSSLYKWNGRLLTNWTTTVLLAAISAIAGSNRAESVLFALCLCAGCFSFAYAVRSYAPELSGWTPLANALLNCWFLWLGYYNFYLGMAICPLVVGYYVRHAKRLRRREGTILAAGFAALFLTHLVAAGLAILCVAVTAVWIHVAAPAILIRGGRPAWSEAARALAASVPTLLLFALFVRFSSEGVTFKPEIADSFFRFPQHIFATADGFSGNQIFLWPAILCFMVVATLAMRRSEWLSARGGLAIAVLIVFGAYLVIPEAGFGGGQVKIRFVWAVFVFGGVLVSSVRRLWAFQAPLAIYIAACVAANLITTQAVVSKYSVAVEDYLTALAPIPEGARVIRLRYPTPDVPAKYGFREIARDPLFHLDAYAAARGKFLDLSDYQAPSRIFPVVYRDAVPRDLQFGLWSLEGPGETTPATLGYLRLGLPVPIDYVIVVEDESSVRKGMEKVHQNLDSRMRLVAKSNLLRIYQRIAPR